MDLTTSPPMEGRSVRRSLILFFKARWRSLEQVKRIAFLPPKALSFYEPRLNIFTSMSSRPKNLPACKQRMQLPGIQRHLCLTSELISRPCAQPLQTNSPLTRKSLRFLQIPDRV